MNTFDEYINGWLAPQSVGTGVGTVFLSFFTGKIAPKLPNKIYKLLDNTLIRIVITAYLLNAQIHRPSLALIISVVMVVGFELIVKFFVPETPSLSDLVKTTTGVEDESKKDANNKGCNCFCGHTIYVQDPQNPKSTKVVSSSGQQYVQHAPSNHQQSQIHHSPPQEHLYASSPMFG